MALRQIALTAAGLFALSGLLAGCVANDGAEHPAALEQPRDLSGARAVAHASSVDLRALSESGAGYCLGPSTETEPYLGMVCTDGASGLPPDEESLFVTWAFRRNGQPAWVVAGRITDPKATELSVLDLRITLADDGFFIARIPEQDWARLSGAEGRLTVLDAMGESIQESCVKLGLAPTSLGTADVSMVASDVLGQTPCEEVDAGTAIARLYLAAPEEGTLTAVDFPSGAETSIRVAELAPGDPPVLLDESEGQLVFFGGDATYVLGATLDGQPQKLGDSSYFMPASEEGRVWLALPDPGSPETERALIGVREVTVTGEVVAESSSVPPSRNLLAALDEALVFQDRRGLILWDPLSGEILRRLPGPFVVAAHHEAVAWCAKACPELVISDNGGMNDHVIHPDGFQFVETYGGAFSADGSFLALPVSLGGSEARGVAVIDVRASQALVVPGWQFGGEMPYLSWSPDGRWLFAATSGGDILAFNVDTQEHIELTVDHPISAMTTG